MRGDADVSAYPADVQTDDGGSVKKECSLYRLAKFLYVGASAKEKGQPNIHESISDYTKSHPSGYPQFPAFLDTDDNFRIYRRYGTLHKRVLLQRQHKLALLKKRLDEMDDGSEGNGEEETERLHLIEAIDWELEAYDELLAKERKSLTLCREPLPDHKLYDFIAHRRGGWERSTFDSLIPHDYTHFQPDASPRHRRGRRREKAANGDSVEEFFSTELFVRDKIGGQKIPVIGRQDSLCAIPLVCSSRWIREMNQESSVMRDVRYPGTTSISGHEVSFQGVVRNMVFTLKGLTFRRDVWVCDQLDGLYDFIFGASFIKENFKLFFQKMFRGAKNVFAGWFTKSKETQEEKLEAEALKAEQEAEADVLERDRLARRAEAREKRKQTSMNEANVSSS